MAPIWALIPTRVSKASAPLLYEARKDLIRERGIKRLLTGGRIPGYSAVAGR